MLLNSCTMAFLKGIDEGKMSLVSACHNFPAISCLRVSLCWQLYFKHDVKVRRRLLHWSLRPSQPELGLAGSGAGVSREAVLPRPGLLLMPMLCYQTPQPARTHTQFRTLQAEHLYQVVNRDHHNVVNRWLEWMATRWTPESPIKKEEETPLAIRNILSCRLTKGSS